MRFAPYVLQGTDDVPVPVEILPASEADIAVTRGKPAWQTTWDSAYLSAPGVEKYAMKGPEN